MNKVILCGNLTRDPEIRSTQSGVSVCNFTIAVNRRMQKDGQQETDFFNIVAWRSLGELCGRYLAKGRKVNVFGSIQTRTYEAKDGTKRSAFDILADEVEFLTPVGAQNSSGSAYQGGGYTQAVNKTAPATGASEGFTEVDDTPMPF